MRKNFLLICSFISFACLHAQSVPQWVHNYRKVYPNSEYLVQRGKGDTAEKSVTDAMAALSRYFQTTVNSNLSATMTSVTADNYIEEKTVVIDDVNVQSQVEFFGLEYTEPYYYEPEQKWYCVVYVNREDAWQQHKPQIDIKKNSFIGLYKNIEKENDSFTKLGLCKKAWNTGTELLEKLEYGRILSPEKEAAYETERNLFSNIPALFEEARQNCSVYLDISTDYNRTISTALSKSLSECGFSVVKTGAEANYTAEVFIEENIAGSDPLYIMPSLNLKIVSKSGKTVYSQEERAAEKSIGYTLESARKKAYPKLSQDLEDGIKKNLGGVFKL